MAALTSPLVLTAKASPAVWGLVRARALAGLARVSRPQHHERSVVYRLLEEHFERKESSCNSLTSTRDSWTWSS